MANGEPEVEQLKWKDYAGESPRELVALKGRFRVDSLVCAFEEALSAKSELSWPEQVILAVEGLEREVNNGGFSQFFTNSTWEYVPTIVEALNAINCPNTALITKQAIESLNLLGEITEDAIQNALTDQVAEELARFDEEFCEYPDPIAERLFEYIALHVNEIHFPSPETRGLWQRLKATVSRIFGRGR